MVVLRMVVLRMVVLRMGVLRTLVLRMLVLCMVVLRDFPEPECTLLAPQGGSGCYWLELLVWLLSRRLPLSPSPPPLTPIPRPSPSPLPLLLSLTPSSDLGCGWTELLEVLPEARATRRWVQKFASFAHVAWLVPFVLHGAQLKREAHLL